MFENIIIVETIELVANTPIDEGLRIGVKMNVIFTVTGHHSNKFYLVKKN